MIRIHIKKGYPIKNVILNGIVNYEDGLKVTIIRNPHKGYLQMFIRFEDKFELLNLKKFVEEKTLKRLSCKLGTIPKLLYFNDVSEFRKGGTVYYKEDVGENKWHKIIVNDINEDGYMKLSM